MQDDGYRQGRFGRRHDTRRRVGGLKKSARALLLALFIGGGLYFGYIFVTTAVSVLTGRPPSPAGPLAGNPSAQATPPAETITSLPDWHGDERLNVLLLGLDQREDERDKPTRTDTMIVLTVDPLGKTATLLAIPRDLWVVVPGHGENKINTAHFYGEADSPGRGPALAKRAIEVNFGIRVHYFARVDFRGFEKLVDNIGGVTVDVMKPIKDDEYPAGDYGIRRIYIPAGVQHLDGKVALQYARTRHGDNDLSRGSRQTQVLVAAKAQAMRLDLLPKLPALLGLLREAIATDIPPNDLLALINLGRQIEAKDIANRAIDWSMVSDINGDGSVLMPKWDQIRTLFAEVFADARLKAEAAKVVVQNGTLRDGLAAATAGALGGRGYTITDVAQAARSDYRETLILDHAGKRYTVQKLAEVLGVVPRNVRSEPGHDADITVILGQDAKVPQ